MENIRLINQGICYTLKFSYSDSISKSTTVLQLDFKTKFCKGAELYGIQQQKNRLNLFIKYQTQNLSIYANPGLNKVYIKNKKKNQVSR
ncbi:unnamed protein product [Paramecium octaurelia]|uniref:Uncharacterized protein n=1 Tax=Paramecium octaurelia TaxID=43137 RepID=A0A8S1WRC5_PAROT|nr:unnamed protein product [Paramecium octaurelia]